ncbi:MAG: hypothetical protein JNK30_11870 [Phenylobacterium sp.]|uniref:hypothetical protein n=1 Tax=Phenylobacterium sp. TaxID=1871053 RepID=UPI001A59F63E|nr:hypothetical protein [Phenylobacterium sp.]MBL8772069.1 hypothetical protein [Phenylobacterium sp.]
MKASRRAVLGVSATLLAASKAAAATPMGDEGEARRILERFDGFGVKASGGPGDTASGAWLESELKALGYATARQPFDAPAYEGDATLSRGGATASVIPQAIVTPTSAAGLSGPLYVAGRDRGPGIALVSLPYARWSTILGPVEKLVAAAIADGASAVGIITDGPTREACALNSPDRRMFDRPVFVISPGDAAKLSALSGPATLAMAGRSFRRPTYNVTARLDRGAGRWLVISTPRSGWFHCAGERGTGLAAWLLLARWASSAKLPVNVALVATSGHEYEYTGGEAYIHALAPKPAETGLWVHLGANVAARDWHERGATLSPLPSADPQRFLLASAPLVPAARAAFAGLPGLESVYTADPALAAGELASILKGGYGQVAGIFGSHRYHHTRVDDLRCVSPALVPPVATAMAQVIASAFRA